MRRLAEERRSGDALEVGPGSGIYLPLLCELFEHVTASDLEAEYLDHLADVAAERPNLELVIDDITDSTLEPSSFDLVLCSEVIEHTRRRPGSSPGCGGCCARVGTLVLTTPQARSTLELAGKIAFGRG